MAVVVINPSGKPGHSFKGLHGYCSHDEGSRNTAERVDWMATRNLALEDPDQAYKIMIATAAAKNDLKKAAGVRGGRPEKLGPVMHVVISFDADEPRSRGIMEKAADDLLTHLGADPDLMPKAKSKPKRRQFADEHQVIMYAHTDKDHHHIHLMINRIHPVTGISLPSNKDQDKAQDWALEFSKRYGTDHKTPAREENKKKRERGQSYIRPKRKPRNVYDVEQAVRDVANDNQVKAVRKVQRTKDALLAQDGRKVASRHHAQRNELVERFRAQKDRLGKDLRRNLRKSEALVTEQYRLKERALHKQHRAEFKTFEAMEKSFFGRAANAFRAVTVVKGTVADGQSNLINKIFKAATDASERRNLLKQAQERRLKALEGKRRKEVREAARPLKRAHKQNVAKARDQFMADRDTLQQEQAKDVSELKARWKNRNRERETVLSKIMARVRRRSPAQEKAKLSHASRRVNSEFDAARRVLIKEQDNQSQEDKSGSGDVGNDLVKKSLGDRFSDFNREFGDKREAEERRDLDKTEPDRDV